MSSANLSRLRSAIAHLTHAIEDLQASLPITPPNADLLMSIRADRDRLIDVVEEIERAGGESA